MWRTCSSVCRRRRLGLSPTTATTTSFRSIYHHSNPTSKPLSFLTTTTTTTRNPRRRQEEESRRNNGRGRVSFVLETRRGFAAAAGGGNGSDTGDDKKGGDKQEEKVESLYQDLFGGVEEEEEGNSNKNKFGGKKERQEEDGDDEFVPTGAGWDAFDDDYDDRRAQKPFQMKQKQPKKTFFGGNYEDDDDDDKQQETEDFFEDGGWDSFDTYDDDYPTRSMDESRGGTGGQKQQQFSAPKPQQLDKGIIRKGNRAYEDPYLISEEQWSSVQTYDDLPDWEPKFVSRISQERVKVLPVGIPTIPQLARIPLPPPPPPHPGTTYKVEKHHGKNINKENKRMYAKYRKQRLYEYIQKEVEGMMDDQKLASILSLESWEEKQDAVDEMFESIEFQLREQEPILGPNPMFSKWVEQAIEDYLKDYQNNIILMNNNNNNGEKEQEEREGEGGGEETEDDKDKEVLLPSDGPYPTAQEDEDALPVFLDAYDSSTAGEDGGDEKVVPKILHPLQTSSKESQQNATGRMMEEWELSAHKQTKRILLRQCTRQVGQILDSEQACRVYVTGNRGCGKTATLASIVASIRTPQQPKQQKQEEEKDDNNDNKNDNDNNENEEPIVLYLPDGDRLHKHGYFVRPNPKRRHIFDLPVLSEEVCQQLLDSHTKQLEGMVVEPDEFHETAQDFMKAYLTDVQLERLRFESDETLLYDYDAKSFKWGDNKEGEEDKDGGGDEKGEDVNSAAEDDSALSSTTTQANDADVTIPLLDLLKIGAGVEGKTRRARLLAPMCYSIVLHQLMNQTKKPFYIVMDEFNCYYEPGHYFHREYDEDEKTNSFIPYEQMSLFEIPMRAMGLSNTTTTANTEEKSEESSSSVVNPPVFMKRGGVIVGITESRAIARQITNSLTARAQLQTKAADDEERPPLHVVEVPRFSDLETDHILSNFEAIGIGNLRNDQGETVMNEQEVAYLKSVSGSIGQKLLDSCCW